MRFRFSKAARIALVAIVALLSGCLPFPLGDPERSTIDPKLEGFWWAQDQDSQALVTLYPFDAHTYVVHTIDAKTVDGKVEPSSMQLYKGWLTMVGNARFMTLEPLSQRLSNADADKKFYVVVRLTVVGSGLQVKALDSDYKPFEAAKSAADISKIIADNVDDPKMYGKDPMTYSHLDPEKDKEKLEPLMKLFK